VRGSEQGLLVIGCGNGFSGDDAAGFHAVRMLAPAHKSNGVRFLAMGRPGIEMLDVFDREERIVFIDAISSGRRAGSIVVSPMPAPGVVQRSSVNDNGWGVAEVLALARSLGRKVPQTTLIGIEVTEERDALLSAPVARAVNYLLENFHELRTLVVAREAIVLEPEEAAIA
jgi:hydrogenase maturation protease